MYDEETDIYNYYRSALKCNGWDRELAIVETAITFFEDEYNVEEIVRKYERSYD